MPTYQYKARDLEGATHKGRLTAPDEEALAAVLRNRDQFLVEAEETAGRVVRALGGRVKRQDLILFTIQLATSLDAGIQILQALEGLEEDAPDPLLPVVRDIGDQIRGGASISEALERHEDVFGQLYANLVAAGEETGTVEDVLFEIAAFLEWQDELVSNLQQMAIYPTIVLTGVAILVLILFNFVLPRLLETITGLGVELSTPTRLLMVMSDLVTGYWYVGAIAVASIVVAVVLLGRHPAGRRFLDGLKLRLPIVGGMFRKVALTRFSHNLSTLYGAGIGILRSLELVESVVGNAVIEERIRTARERISMGSSLSEALADAEEFPGLVLQMIAVGERTGSLDTSLEKVREFYDREIPRTVDRLFAVMEPALILILGAIIALVALGVYLPIYSVIQHIGP